MNKDEIKIARLYLAQGRKIAAASVTFMLRSCDKNMGAYGGFKWPQSGAVECADWNGEAVCGGGLHGLLMGAGDVTLTAQNSKDAKWLVCAIWAADVVELNGKVKAPRAWVVLCGTRDEAVAEITALGATCPVYGTATAGVRGTATAGVRGTATAGVRGTATAGVRGTATAGDEGTATAGVRGTATGTASGGRSPRAT